MKFPVWLCVLILLLGSALPCLAAPSLVDHYRKALEVDPQNQTLRYHLGLALLNRGDNRQALDAFRAVYPQKSADPELNFNLALVYSRLGDPDSALLYLDQAAASGAAGQPEIYPLQNIYFNLALLYEQQGQLDEAVHLLQRLCNENPTHLEYLRLLGDVQLRLGRTDSAIETFSAYLQQRPADSEIREYVFAALFNLGLDAYGRQDFVGARHEFQRAGRFVADSPLVTYYLALIDYQQQAYLKVAEQLPSVYTALTDDMQTSARSLLYNTALALKQTQKDPAAAIDALAPLTLQDSPRAKDLELLAVIQLQMKQFEAARQSFLRVLAINPGDAQAANGILAAEKGAFNEILDEVGQAFAANDLPRVRTLLERAAGIYPKDNRLQIYQMRLARASQGIWQKQLEKSRELETGKRYAEALATLRQGLKVAPDEPQLLNAEKRLAQRLSSQVDTLFSQGKEQFATGEMHKARTSFEQLVSLNPGHAAAKDYLQQIDAALRQQAQRAIGAGDAALERGELLEARTAYKRALAARPAEPLAQEGLKRVEQMVTARGAETLEQARRARAEGNLLAALESLDEGLRKWPNADLEAERGRILRELARRQQSLLTLARTAIGKKQFSRAAQIIERARRLDADAPALAGLQAEYTAARTREVKHQLDLGAQRMKAGEIGVALKAYRRALDIDPGNDVALTGLQEGRRQLQEVIAQFLAEGKTAHQAGEFDQAQQAYRKVLELDPHQAEALAELRRIERVDRSGLSGADSKRLYLQGIELYTAGNYQQAIALWREVLDLDPANAKAQMNIDKAERKLKQIRERQNG